GVSPVSPVPRKRAAGAARPSRTSETLSFPSCTGPPRRAFPSPARPPLSGAVSPLPHQRDPLLRAPSRRTFPCRRAAVALRPSRASARFFRAHHARELDAPHLAASRERQGIKEADLVRDLVIREHA